MKHVIVGDPWKPLTEVERAFAKAKARALQNVSPFHSAGVAREQLSPAPVHVEQRYVHYAGRTETFTEEFMQCLFRNVLANR